MLNYKYITFALSKPEKHIYITEILRSVGILTGSHLRETFEMVTLNRDPLSRILKPCKVLYI